MRLRFLREFFEDFGFRELLAIMILLAYIILLPIFTFRLGVELNGVLDGLGALCTTIVGYYFGNRDAIKVSKDKKGLKEEIEELGEEISERENYINSLDSDIPVPPQSNNIKIKVDRRKTGNSYFSSNRKHALIRIYLDTTGENRKIKYVKYILDKSYKKRERLRSNKLLDYEILTSAYGPYDFKVIVTFEDEKPEIYESDDDTWSPDIKFLSKEEK